MKIIKITKVKPKTVYAIKTTSKTYIADGLLHHNCSTCNRFYHGRLDKYLMFMLRKYGQAEVDRLYTLNGQTVIYKIADYERIALFYKEKLEKLLLK